MVGESRRAERPVPNAARVNQVLVTRRQSVRRTCDAGWRQRRAGGHRRRCRAGGGVMGGDRRGPAAQERADRAEASTPLGEGWRAAGTACVSNRRSRRRLRRASCGSERGTPVDSSRCALWRTAKTSRHHRLDGIPLYTGAQTSPACVGAMRRPPPPLPRHPSRPRMRVWGYHATRPLGILLSGVWARFRPGLRASRPGWDAASGFSGAGGVAAQVPSVACSP